MTIKILSVHGLGGHPDQQWMQDWETAVRRVLPTDDVSFHFVAYDPLFEGVSITPDEAVKAVFNLLRSGFSAPFRPRGVGKVLDFVHYTAGCVAAWLEDRDFQRQTRKMILDNLLAVQPTVVLAHSLGSLLTYDAFAQREMQDRGVAKALKKVRYVTFGSQLNNGFVIGNLTQGRIVRLPVHRWVHLYNENDRVFTAPISLPGADNFLQLRTLFGGPTGINNNLGLADQYRSLLQGHSRRKHSHKRTAPTRLTKRSL